MATGKLVPVGAVAPELAVANAVTKAGTPVKKPVIGRKRTLDYTLEIEREGQVVPAQVHEERGFEVGALGAGLLGLGAVIVGGAAVAVASDPEGARKAYQKRKEERAAAKEGRVGAQDRGLLGMIGNTVLDFATGGQWSETHSAGTGTKYQGAGSKGN